MALLTGKRANLLSFEEVRRMLHARSLAPRGLQDIPLKAIVGSVGRYADFTRTFLPKQSDDQSRWVNVFKATSEISTSGLPPVEVYQIGSAYFVKDGNHRVSVARQMGVEYVQAYVTEVKTTVPLTPDMDFEAILVKAHYTEFLEKTRIKDLRPDADLCVTLPGQYERLLEHVEVHRYFMGIEQEREIPYEEAAAHWYDTVYMPIIAVIRERGLLRDFPDRTEADLYLWIMEHRAELEESLGWQVDAEQAADHLASEYSTRAERVASRVGDRLLSAVTPEGLESGPPPGAWRKQRTQPGEEPPLFDDILVPLSGEEYGWQALEQAIIFAKCEGAYLRGLHVVPDPAQKESHAALAVQDRFNRRCQETGVSGTLVIEAGNINRMICDRSRWVDLAVVKLEHPPEPQPIARLSSGFRTLIHRCPRPVLAVPRKARPLDSALLAYDGGAKSKEGLFVAAYLTEHWHIPLTVLTVMESDREMSETLFEAEAYLRDKGLRATYLDRSGPVAKTILETAESQNSDLIIMGGYGFNPVLEVVLGSAVNQVLRESRRPVLICR
jgi:nucleotide-binding universal stress UspA family protein